MDEVAIKVSHVSKNFRLPHEKTTSVKSIFVNAFHSIQQKRSYATQHALKDIDFEIKKGEFFGIVGRNGSGKSTLLKILAGIYQPTQGKVEVHGKLVPFIELGVGFNPELTGRENVYLNGALLGFSQQEVEAMYDEIVAFAEIGKFMDQKLKNYSSGMQVRLAFSMAIRAEADILLVDEVLAVGDADFQRKCFDYFKKLKKDKKTVVFVSHDMNSVREYCDRVLMIEKSEVIAEGSADKVAMIYTRLFLTDNTVTGSDSISAKRWGNQDIAYTKVDVRTSEQELIISVEAAATQAVEDAIFGFSIRDASGKVLFGTNTDIEKKKVGGLRKGSVTSIRWKMQNILNDGEYHIEPAIIRENGEICDWWEDAKKFKVLKTARTPYAIYPIIHLEIDTNSH